ncbi:hypothetical protein Lal_00001188 [Lupinus albus]|nr:hypothetical protein Lal_00001188 [Lupinus albus]
MLSRRGVTSLTARPSLPSTSSTPLILLFSPTTSLPPPSSTSFGIMSSSNSCLLMPSTLSHHLENFLPPPSI